MNILILGATGYLGKNVVYSLKQKQHRVYSVARKNSDFFIERYSDKIISCNLHEIERLFETERIDWIINAAGVYKLDSSLYENLFDANITFPLSVLNIAVKKQVRNFINIGTSLPYEINMYSYSKHIFSEIAEYLSRFEHINFYDLKVEMFYGGYDEPMERFINNCYNKLLNNEDIMLTKGVQKRDIVHIDDVIGVIGRLIDTNYSNGYIELQVGAGENMKIRSIVEYMREIMNSESTLMFGMVPSRENEPDTLANIQWYNEIGYKNKYTIREGLLNKCKK